MCGRQSLTRQREDGQDCIGIERHRLMGRYAKEDMTNGNATDVEADGIEGIMISRYRSSEHLLIFLYDKSSQAAATKCRISNVPTTTSRIGTAKWVKPSKMNFRSPHY